MNHLAELWPFVALGLLGSLHCAGMCGGFAIAASLEAPNRRAFLGRQLAHQLGKASTYAVVCGLVAHAGVWSGIGGQRTAAWLAGAGLVALGLLQLFPTLRRAPGTNVLERPLRLLSRGARDLPGLTGRFATGVVNGLLPCGLSAGAFLLAVDRPPPVALLGGFAFGAAPVPVLLATATLARLRPIQMGRLGPRVLGVGLVLFGLLTWTRTSPGASTDPANCHDASAGAVGSSRR